MTRSERCKEWETRIVDFQSSGQSLSVWCALHNLKAHQVRYWIQKLKRQNQPTAKPNQWLAVEIKDAQPMCQESPLLVKVGAATIEIYPGFNSKLLSEVVRTLSTRC